MVPSDNRCRSFSANAAITSRHSTAGPRSIRCRAPCFTTTRSAAYFTRWGIGEDVEKISQPSATYQWFNAEWKTLVEIDWSAESISDGPVGYLFNQPSLEALFDSKAKSLPNVSVQQGWEATAVHQHTDYCEVTLREGTMMDGTWTPTGNDANRARPLRGRRGRREQLRAQIGGHCRSTTSGSRKTGSSSI